MIKRIVPLIAAKEITYGKLIWQFDPEEALAEARRRIDVTSQDASANWLFLSDLAALEKLPDELAECHHLEKLSVGDDFSPEGKRFLAFSDFQVFASVGIFSAGDEVVTVARRLKEVSSLSKLANIRHIVLDNTPVPDLTPLSGLAGLKSLSCSGTQVVDLTPLSGLAGLKSLSCSGTQVVDLTPLSGLSGLESLDCDNTQVVDLTPLSGLAGLKSLSCSGTQVVDLTPLSGLSGLESLDCDNTQLVDLSPLSGLAGLKSLSCSGPQVVDLTPLSGLSGLESLDCSGTQVVDLTPLSGLSGLESLNCYNTRVVDLTPLSGLAGLKSFNCSGTQVVDLTPLSGLSGLESLNCYSTQVVDLTPLSGLAGLKRFICDRTQVVDLTPLSGLSGLKSLNCSGTQVVDLTPLSGLSGLESLNCDNTRVVDLTPLSGLARLERLDCDNTQVVDLTPLSGLAGLKSLSCSGTQVVDLTPLSGLSGLESLKCYGTQVVDLTPLSGLAGLKGLSCSFTQVVDLTPLSGLARLERLDCSNSQVVDLVPISKLGSLRKLDCSNAKVVDLTPLSGLLQLQSLDCSNLKFPRADGLFALIRIPVLVNLRAHRTRVVGVPDELFSSDVMDNCLERVRAHLADLGSEPKVLDTVKLIVLGNGRIGKTQICNRLRGLPFEDEADSTHGIQIVDAPIPGAEGTFRIWDFGGQDIYHGTHALFLRSRAVFLLVWTPGTDNSDEDIPAYGLSFRNRPVGWWLNFVQQFGEPDTPLVVVQNQIDNEGEYDRGDHPDLRPLRKDLVYCRALAMSASTMEGLPALKDLLKGAAEHFNPPLIGSGRLSVMNKLREMLAKDQSRPPEARKHRTLSMDEFVELCEINGGISSPEQFLSFLHNAGEVFWNRHQTEYAVILDQAWALDAIYAVYDRRKCWPKLEQSQGRFTRLHMGSFLWDREGYSVEEQRLFLSFMCQSGICFRIAGNDRDDTAVYIAPDALPERLETGHPPTIENADAEHIFEFDQIPAGFMRSLLVDLGAEAGVYGTYWRTGFSGFEKTQQTQIRVEQIQKGASGFELQVSVKGEKAEEILSKVAKFCTRNMQLFNMTPNEPALQNVESEIEMTFASPPNSPTNFFVSYAWGDERNPERAKIVDEFCQRAEAEGVNIRRDREEVQFGQSITEFMERLVEGDRVLIVLTEKYLHSVPCMTELYQIWHASGHDRDQFKSRVRLFTSPDAKIHTPVDRAKVGKFWQERYEEEKPWIDNMGDDDRLAHNQLKRFYTHVPDILHLISDVVQPQSLDDLIEYALD